MKAEDIYIIVGVTLTLVLILGGWFYFKSEHEKLKETVNKNSNELLIKLKRCFLD